MRGFTTGLLALAAAMLSASAMAQTATSSSESIVVHGITPGQLPVEAFGDLPLITGIAISPDGTKVVIGTHNGPNPAIDVYDLNTGQRTPLATISGRDLLRAQLRSVDWADNTRVMFGETQTVHAAAMGVMVNGQNDLIDYYRPGVIDLAHPEVRYLSTTKDHQQQRYNSGSRLIAPIEGEPGYGRMIGYDRGAGHLAPYRVNLTDGDPRMIEVEGANIKTRGFDFDSHGNVVARTDIDQDTDHWSLFIYNDGHPRPFRDGVSDTGAPDAGIEGVLPDGRLVFKDEKGDPSSLLAVNRATGATEPLFHHAGSVGVLQDPWTREVVGAVWDGDRNNVHFFDPAIQAAHDTLVQSFPDSLVRIDFWSRDHSRMLVYREDGLDGGGYYVYFPQQRQMRRIGMRYPQVAAIDIGVRELITYHARDGTPVPAYLTLPANVDPHHLPTVLLVHGGPHGVRDNPEFDWWSGFLVSRGYAVLQPNYRGSGGYGKAWEDAGRHHWGDGVMQTDVEDGLAALIRSGITDPARVCIVGASYGGYAALAGATITPDRYVCAVSVSGPADLSAMLVHESERGGGHNNEAAQFWRHSIGDPAAEGAHIRAVSPALLAERVHIPVLLIHGVDDTVVPYQQSQEMNQQLQAAGKNVHFVTLDHEDHWMSDGSTRIQMLREQETFLAQYLGSSARPASVAQTAAH